jgi:cell division protein ZapA
MPLVNIMVNNRAYTIACDDGEEAHLKDLAAHVDAKAREVLGSVGQVGDARMLLMAALLIADEHHELTGHPGNMNDGERQSLHLRAERAESAAADALESAAKRLEDIAVRLSHA